MNNSSWKISRLWNQWTKILLWTLVTPKVLSFMRLLFLLWVVTPKRLLFSKNWSNYSVTLLQNNIFMRLAHVVNYTSEFCWPAFAFTFLKWKGIKVVISLLIPKQGSHFCNRWGYHLMLQRDSNPGSRVAPDWDLGRMLYQLSYQAWKLNSRRARYWPPELVRYLAGYQWPKQDLFLKLRMLPMPISFIRSRTSGAKDVPRL